MSVNPSAEPKTRPMNSSRRAAISSTLASSVLTICSSLECALSRRPVDRTRKDTVLQMRAARIEEPSQNAQPLPPAFAASDRKTFLSPTGTWPSAACLRSQGHLHHRDLFELPILRAPCKCLDDAIGTVPAEGESRREGRELLTRYLHLLPAHDLPLLIEEGQHERALKDVGGATHQE